MRICGKALPPRAALLLAIDLCLFVGVLPVLVAAPSFVRPATGTVLFSAQVLVGLMATGIAWQIVFYYNELYNLQIIRKRDELVLHLLQGVGMTMLLLALFFLATPLEWSPKLEQVLSFAALAGPLAYMVRRSALPRVKESVLIVGSGENAGALIDVIASVPEWNMEVVEIADLKTVVRRTEQCTKECPQGIDRVIVCPEFSQDSRLLEVLLDWKLSGINVEDATNFYERATGRVRVADITPAWFVFSSGFENGRRKRAAKRALDIIVGGFLFILTVPVMACVTAAVAVEGSGPILFCQDRIGLHGHLFRIRKFRTMRPQKSNAGETWVTQDASRITPLGAILRRYRLDELPQLWNVLTGTMSIVGPRPEQPKLGKMLADQIPFYHQRHTVPPGLTGWAQVRYHYGASVEESQRKLEFDLFYVKHLSTWLDIAVLVETIKVVIAGRGAM
jgi:exopolysaccharide biosynthesis polyprenyl glycosylphosphotransferase